MLRLLWLAALPACLPVPEPLSAKVGRQATGADYTASAVGRWACKGIDFVVAKGPRGMLLHDLDLDIVDDAPKASGDALVFRVSDGVIMKTFTVPADPTAPAQVHQVIATSSGTFVGLQGPGMTQTTISVGNQEDHATQSCPAAPKVALW
jgi:hypothetical protein